MLNRDRTVPKPAARPRQLKHIHHSPLFWVGAVLFLAAITIYIFSEDLSFLPHIY